MWFRVEWSPFSGGGLNMTATMVPSKPSGYTTSQTTAVSRPTTTQNFTPSPFGSILWIQRLEKEPPRW